ncbi:MAG: STAS domain-containing protein [Candidatus Eisenbacteria bacterium]
MRFSQETRDGVVAFHLSGQLMGGLEAEGLREAILSAIDRGVREIHIDMGEVPWVNSAGLGILIAAHLALRKAGGHLKFFHVSKRIEAILSVTRLNTVFEIQPGDGPPPGVSASPISGT